MMLLDYLRHLGICLLFPVCSQTSPLTEKKIIQPLVGASSYGMKFGWNLEFGWDLGEIWIKFVWDLDKIWMEFE